MYFTTWRSLTKVSLQHNLILCGGPGSGKTTIAKMLAKKLDMKVIDIDDDHLEPFWGMPVAQKVTELEPQGFEVVMRAECEAFRQLQLPPRGYVISLTGSTPISPESRAHMRKLGKTIFLDVTANDIIRRLGRMKVDRIFKHKPGATIQEVLEYRKQFYMKSFDYRALVPEQCNEEQTMQYVYQCVERMASTERYTSTRQTDQSSEGSQFLDVIRKSVAADGGLYCPTSDPVPFDPGQLKRLEMLSWNDLVLAVQEKLIHPSQVNPQKLHEIIQKAYRSFQNPNCPISVVRFKDDLHISELFHGPSASFKDFPLQQLPHFYQLANMSPQNSSKTLILVATSGDTGGATLDGFQRLQSDDIEVVVLHPEGNTSELQAQQMLSYHNLPKANVIGVKGNFDDCQKLVKNAFQHFQQSGKPANYHFAAANSVNWGRIVGQISMHFGTYFEMVRLGSITVGEPIQLAIPTGNFGNIYAAWLAKRMGLPIHTLIMASNVNNVLTDFVSTGTLDYYRPMIQTSSPAIDILRPSNLERFLFQLSNRNTSFIKDIYKESEETGKLRISDTMLDQVRCELKAGFCVEDNVRATQRTVQSRYNYMMDPHTAVAYSVGLQKSAKTMPLVILSTAHPFKFPLMDFQMTSEANLAKPGPHAQLSELMRKDRITKEARSVLEVKEIIDRF